MARDPWGPADPKSSPPKPATVNEFHERADTDVSALSIHHTLGVKGNQAAPGDHSHDNQNHVWHGTLAIDNCSTGVWNQLNMTSVWDPQGMNSGGVITLSATGIWEFTGVLFFGVRIAAAAHLLMGLRSPDMVTEYFRWSSGSTTFAGAGASPSGSVPILFNKGTQVRFAAWQDSGGNCTMSNIIGMAKLIVRTA